MRAGRVLRVCFGKLSMSGTFIKSYFPNPAHSEPVEARAQPGPQFP